MRLLNKVLSWLRRDEGQTLVEYALIVGLVSIAGIVAMMLMGDGITGIFTNIGDALGNVPLL
jgi:pilus assembly protein Flp/PilA